MNDLTADELYKKINSFSQTDFSQTDAKNILFKAESNGIKYFTDNEQNLYEKKDNSEHIITCNKIIENHISLLKNEIKNSIGIEKYSLENQIAYFSRINSQNKVGQNEFYYNIKKENLILKAKIENSYEEGKSKNGLWNKLTIKQKAAAVSEISSKYIFLKPDSLINFFNKNPSELENYLDKDATEKIKSIRNINKPQNILYNLIENAYHEQLEPSSYRIERNYINDIKECNFTDDKENGKKFIDSLFKEEKDLIFAELYDNINEKLIYSETKYLITDHENNLKYGLMNSTDFTNLYNENKKGNQKIQDKTSSIILDYLEKNEKPVIWNNKNIYLKDNRTGYQYKTNINEIIETAQKLAEKEKNKIIEKNHYKNLSGNPVILLSEGTLESSTLEKLCEKLKENYNGKEESKYDRLEAKITKLEQERDKLSINNRTHLEEKKQSQSLSYKNHQKLIEIEKRMTSGLNDEQIESILKATEKMAERAINLNNSKGRKK